MSSVVGKLSAEQVEEFCNDLRKTLLNVVQDGHIIYLGRKATTEPEIVGDEYPGKLGELRYTGQRIIVEYGAPAEKRLRDYQKTLTDLRGF